METLRRIVERDPVNRVGTALPEISYLLSQNRLYDSMTSLVREGKLPLRVTHNDTKLNNVLFDRDSREILCVVDLDTVMPGLAANDFGDTIRYGASTTAEDEEDLEKVHMNMDYYQAFAEAFLESCGEILFPLERETLPMGARLMTLESGIRFLTDYLEGDVYFKTEKPMHNLYRARTQIRLVQEMDAQWEQMNAVIRNTKG